MADIYKYFCEPGDKITDFSSAMQIIRAEKLIIDTKYLKVIEAAERGYCTAWIELQEGFRKGQKGLPQNYRMARYYSDLMIRACKEEADSQEPFLLFESYRAAGYLEMDNGNHERAALEFGEAIKLMVNRISPQEWDFNILHFLHQAIFPNEPIG